MKRIGLLIAIGIFLWIANGNAEDVLIYCKEGTVIQGQLVHISKNEIKIDPRGPITLRRLSTSDVDSVVSISGKQRVTFPLSENEIIPDFGRYRPISRSSPFIKMFKITFYGSYRFPATAKEIEAEDELGNLFTVPLELDGSTGAGLTMGYLWPASSGKMYVEGFFDLGLTEASTSLSYPGGRLVLYSWRYVVLDAGLKPMIPLVNRRVKLFLSPMFGVGVRVSNFIPDVDIMGREQWEGAFAAIWGGGLDLLSSGKIAVSADVKFAYSKHFLDELFKGIDAFTVPEARITFSLILPD